MLQDGQGSTRQLLNSSQTVVASYISDAFGNSVGGSGSSANPFIWNGGSGYYSDGESGLQKVGARYYDPAVGRFISQDHKIIAGSAGDGQALNRFNYCEGNSIGRSDPSGDLPNVPRWLHTMILAWSIWAKNYGLTHPSLPERSPAKVVSEVTEHIEAPEEISVEVPEGAEAVAAAGEGAEGGEIIWGIVIILVF